MNDVSDRMVDIVLNHEQQAPPAAVNIVHTNPIPWSTVQTLVSEALYEAGVTPERLPLVSFAEWFTALEAAAKDLSNLNDLVRIIYPRSCEIRSRFTPSLPPRCSISTIAWRLVRPCRPLKPMKASDLLRSLPRSRQERPYREIHLTLGEDI
jgi:hypothetical protein